MLFADTRTQSLLCRRQSPRDTFDSKTALHSFVCRFFFCFQYVFLLCTNKLESGTVPVGVFCSSCSSINRKKERGMAKSKEELKERYRQSRENFSKKLLKVFSAATAELGKVSEIEELSKEERQECVYSLNKLHYFNGGGRGPGWPSVQVEEFLSVESSFYDDQLTILRGLRIETMGRFLKIPFFVIRAKFMEQGVRLPAVFEILHREFHQQTAPPPEKQARFSIDPALKDWLQSSHAS